MNIHVSARTGHREPDIDPTFARDAVQGLSGSPKKLSPKYFYDETGSDLFEEITRLPEYYPTRTELGILRERGREIIAAIPPNAALIEFGAGATTKARLLLAQGHIGAYVPVDISGAFLNRQAETLRRDFPRLAVHPVVADFTRSFALPKDIAALPKAGFFPGSTIGNFEPEEACAFLRNARDILGPGAALIVGVDLEKDDRTLQAAYDDESGVTGRFNKNILSRINHELDGDFNISRFAHRAVYNHTSHRIEMHLVSEAAQTVHLLGHDITFRAGESIHTESSYKYSVSRFQELARRAGWTPDKVWTDARNMFSVHALRAGVI
jgi:dimethylhistidine N-methyltransferase